MGIYSNRAFLRFLNIHTAIKCVKMNPNSNSWFSCQRLCLFSGFSSTLYTIWCWRIFVSCHFLLYFCLRLASRRTLFVQILTWKRIVYNQTLKSKRNMFLSMSGNIREWTGVSTSLILLLYLKIWNNVICVIKVFLNISIQPVELLEDHFSVSLSVYITFRIWP